ncbi:MAG TPA: biotin/lipoyl-containing protein [Caulobacteraceae bacterium]|nr:biotin/lipoyl-containing protein [Caulobacteraceae bacterium]
MVKLPVLGDTTKVAVIAEWLVDVGDRVEVGTPLMSVETDKVTVEVPSPVAGTLSERLVAEQDEVPIGAPIARIQG